MPWSNSHIDRLLGAQLTHRHSKVSSLLLTLSQHPASGMWEGLWRSAERTVSNLGGVEITGELGKEFTMKALKEIGQVRHKQELPWILLVWKV